jgi:hypothetical protein
MNRAFKLASNKLGAFQVIQQVKGGEKTKT